MLRIEPALVRTPLGESQAQASREIESESIFVWRHLLPLLAAVLLAGALTACGGREHAQLAPPPPLSLTVTDPVEGVTTHAPTLPVRGRVTGGPALLGLNGRSLALGVDGGFATSISLVDGANRLVFDVWPEPQSGRGSNLLPNTPPALHLVRVVNFTWPSLSVQFTAPDEGVVLKTSPVRLAGLVSEPTATVSVNGVQAMIDGDGRFTVEIPLVEGPNTLTADAQTTLSSGNRHATAVRHLTYAPPTAPLVHILEPVEGFITRAASLIAKGTVSDPADRLNVMGQPVAVGVDGTWSISLVPQEGPFILSAEATNPDGLTGSDIRHLVIDRTPPRIDLDTIPPTPTRLTQLPLAGKVVDATPCQLWVEDAATGLTGPSAAARFSTSVPLAEGVNTLHFRAVDAAGNVGALVITVDRDTQGPGITLDPLPPDGECTLQVSGRAKDPTGAVSFTRDGVALPSADNAFAFTWSLNPGLNSTTLRATDALGNTSELSLTRTCTQPTPPPPPTLTLTVTAPQEGQSFTQPSAAVAGRVSDPFATVTVNGISLPPASDGTFSGTVSLAQGLNLITFSATTPSGQSDTTQRHVTYNPAGIQQAPVIVFDNPRDGYATSEKSITIIGHVDDPRATLKLQGQNVSLDEQGRFQIVLAPAQEGVVGVRAEAVNPYGTGRNAMYVSFQWSALQMAWDDPTPVEGSRLTTPHLTSAVTLSRAALVDLNGQAGALEPNEKGPHPFRAQADLTVEEGLVVLTATAVDAGGNKSTLARNLAVGLTAPVITFTAPAFDANGAIRTLQTGVTVSGTLTAPGIVKPLVLSLNGQAVPLDAQGAFSWTFSGLAFGPNALRAVATNSFGQSARADRMVERVQDAGGDLAPKLTVESPLEGFATGSPSLSVVGRVNQAGLAVKVQGKVVSVDPLTLRFAAGAELVAGPNTLVVSATDAQGRSDNATIHGARFEEGQAKYRWDLPANGARISSHTVKLTGQADQPGIQCVNIHGAAMTLSGIASSGAFQGSLVLPRGPQSLLLEARTVAGERLAERREVIIDPPLPRIRLDAPSSARPGDRITLTVQPAPGTTLASADLRWNGALLGHLQDPFPAQTATIPGDATPGSKLLVEAIATDLEGESVTARTYVVVLAGGGGGTGGPLVWSVLDDRSGLVLTGVQARSETGAPLEFGEAGLATLPSMLPAQWVGAAKPGFTPQWRRGDQLGSKAQALFDARLTPLDPTQDAAVAGFSGSFGNGAYQLTIPGGALSAAGKLSLTPLSTQGLPALLPKGWSAVSALWMQLDGATLTGQAMLKLTPLAGTPNSGLVWARFDDTTKIWIVLATNIEKIQLAALPVPNPGGYALVTADPAPFAPLAEAGKALGGALSGPWREGLKAVGAVDPSMLPTVEAVNGVRAAARLDLAFEGKEAVASGAPLLAEIVETYTRVDQSLIEPEKRAQDGVTARFVLSVDKDGAPALRPVADGLAMELPVRMSRTFQVSELVEGLIQVGFYHEDQVIAVGGELIGTGGGSTTRDGVIAGFDAGAFAAATLVGVQGDPVGSWEALWPELKDLGRVAASFSVDLSGILQKGMTLAVADLGLVPSGVAPILVQRRIVADQRVLVAVGAMAQDAGAWKLSMPPESNPILEGGAFAVLVPTRAWAWVTGPVRMPQALAGAMVQALKHKAGGINPFVGASNQIKPHFASGVPAEDVPVKDALISGNFLQAASGATGLFALPAFAPATGKMTLAGQRWDLGITGSAAVEVPSTGNTLRLVTIPFAIQAILPQENAVVDLSAAFVVLTTTPMDASAIAGVKLFRKQGADPNSTLVEIAVRRQLSMDGRTLVVTPDQSLVQGTDHVVVVEVLKSLAGESAPRTERHVSTATLPPPPAEADFTRIALGYPDPSFNVPMTIPAGAVPAGAALLIEGLGMGYTYSGTMPNGELKLTIRASLGERIRITAQIAGRTTVGHVSRYEAGDGSGRVTIGTDGGRVEATDGSGAAAVIPSGSLDSPAEFTVSFTTELPVDLDPSLATFKDKTAGRIQLWVDREVAFKFRPRIEVPAPANPSQAEHSDGLGPYAVFDRVEGFEEDGSPCVFFQMTDTAALSGARLVSQGGLPEPMPMPEGSATPGFKVLSLPMNQGITRTATQGMAGSMAGDRSRAPLGASQGYFGISLYRGLDSFLADSGPHFVSGQVTIRVGDGAEQPAAGAFITFSKSLATLKRAGQMLQRTGPTGYYILASFLTDELVRGGGQVMAVDKDWGVSGSSGTSWGGPGGAYGKYYHVSTIRLKVTPSDREDRIAPWAELRFEGRDVIGSEEARLPSDGGDGDIQVVVNGYDNRDKSNLRVEVILDGVKLDQGVVFSRAGEAGKWKVQLKRLGQGLHLVEARVEDQKRNPTRLTKTLRVLDLGYDPPVDQDRAPSFQIEVDGGRESARTGTMVAVKFSEPVSGVAADSLFLEKQSGTSWGAVPTRMLGSSGLVVGGQRLHTVFMIPDARLETGGRYRVRGTEAITDFDTSPKRLNQAPLEFRVASYTEVGTFAVPETGIRRVAAIGGRTFVAVANRIYLIRAGGATTVPAVAFGLPSADWGDPSFLGGEITEMKVFRQVPVHGWPMDLLVVTTAPLAGDSNHQAGLWVFNACNANAVPKLMFGVSLGPGASGYAPTLDCAGGYITVGRLASSIAVVNVSAGLDGWNGTPITAVHSPVGANQQAIQQPLYLANPEGPGGSSHPGVAMLPTSVGTTGSLTIVVGYPGSGVRDGRPLRGMPTAILPSDAAGGLILQPPFVPLSGLPPDLAGPSEADKRAYPGPFAEPLGGAASRVSVVPNLNVRQADGSTKQISLALGVTTRPSGFGGNSLAIMNEANPAAPAFQGTWPTEALGTDPSGKAKPYELPRVSHSVDPITRLVAMPVKFTDDGALEWFVLDFSQPATPKTVARIPAAGQYGSLHNGLLSIQDAGGVKILKIADGVAGVDEGECEKYEPRVEIAMDGERKGSDRLEFTDVNKKYLFWVNDDNDQKYFDINSLMNVEDDLPGSARNCDDDEINSLRDLEDFTRLHLQVDPFSASWPGMTYWLRFENVIGNPMVNLFEAVKPGMNYLKSYADAENQILQKRRLIVGTTEVSIPIDLIKPGGAASLFLLEGAGAGKGKLTFIAKKNGTEVARVSLELELREPEDFVDTWEVKTHMLGSQMIIEDSAGPRGNYRHVPEKADEYVLFVHGWNMKPHEKPRWTETTFKRLWWLGYKGHVGAFYWPSLGLFDYDPSEFNGWLSAEALKNHIQNLDVRIPGGVRVIAHSQGNVVAGEALRLFDKAVVHSYIATQAALPAHGYDKGIAEYRHLTPWATPNIYRYYFRDSNSHPYFETNATKVKNGMFRYFNVDDLALNMWIDNNGMKPVSGYVYHEGDDDKETYYEERGDAFRSRSNTLKMPKDHYEILAFGAQARSLALGAELKVNGFSRSEDLQSWGFNGKHYSHSRQFRSNIIQERPYWTTLATDFDLTLIASNPQ